MGIKHLAISLASVIAISTRTVSAAPAAEFLEPIRVPAVQAEGWLKDRIDRSARRMEELGKQERLFRDLENQVDWGADYPGRWLEVCCLLAKCSTGEYDIESKLDHLLEFQQEKGNFGNPQEASILPTYWGDHRGLIALAVLSKETGSTKAMLAGQRLANHYVRCVQEEDWKALNGIQGDTACALEGMVAFYELTGKKEYLEACKKLATHAMLNLWQLKGHSHSILTTVRGLADLYQVTLDPRYLDACKHVCTIVEAEHEYTSGGIPETFPDDGDGDETCSTADWLRLNLHLWRLTRDYHYLDAAEKIALNHLPFAQLENGGFVAFRNLTDRSGEEWDFCCTHHGALALVRLLENIYSKERTPAGDQILHVNLFIPSEVKVEWPDASNLRIVQRADYPGKGSVNLTLYCEKAEKFNLQIHLPSTARVAGKKLSLKVNGKSVIFSPGHPEIAIQGPHRGKWKNGDVVQIDFPLSLRTQRRPAWQTAGDEVCLWYGPVLLARSDYDPTGLPFRFLSSRQDYRNMELDQSVHTYTPLKIGSRQYQRGLGMHSMGQSIFGLQNVCERFQAEVGIDNNPDTKGEHGSVVFVVQTDDREKYRSEVLRGGMEPVAVLVGLEGAKRLSLIVEDAGDGIGFDQADWAEARIVVKGGREILISDEIRKQRKGPWLPGEVLSSPQSILHPLAVKVKNDFGIQYDAKGILEETPVTAIFEPLASVDPKCSAFGVWTLYRKN